MYNFDIICDYVAAYEQLLANREKLLTEILSNTLPGDICSQKKGPYISFVKRETVDKKRLKKVISTGDRMLPAYADKYFAKALLPSVIKNHEAAQAFLKKHSGKELRELIGNMDKRILAHSRAAQNVHCFDPEVWLNTPYHRLDDYDAPQFPTLRGEYVRSKSESTIADSLLHAGLLYKPECPLELEDSKTHEIITCYPDFSILHPFTLEEIYWEHFGQMDKADYAAKQCRKLQLYSENGIIQGKNLIITMETKAVPFVARQAEQTIDAFFNKIIW